MKPRMPPAFSPIVAGTKPGQTAFTFTPREPFLFIAAGLDLEESKRDAAVMWLDSIQLERGGEATAYEPRHALESFVETSEPGNIFLRPDEGAAFTVRAFNDGVAYRHLIPGDDAAARVPDESSTFVLPASSMVWYAGLAAGHYEDT